MTVQTSERLTTPGVDHANKGGGLATRAVAVIGVGYTLSWIAGLSIAAPSPKLSATGSQIVSELAGHGASVTASFAFTEGLPAIGLVVVAAAIAGAIRRAGRPITARLALIAGLSAAAISVTQFIAGVALARTSTPGTAHLLYELVNRLDGVKMLALAGLALTVAVTSLRPSWLRYLGGVLAVTIASSGIAYLLLVDSMAVLAYVAGVVLLVFVPAAGITLRSAGGR